MSKPLHKPNAFVEIRTGPPGVFQAWAFGVPFVRDAGGNRHPHEAWKDELEYNPEGEIIAGPHSFEIEMISNYPPYAFQTHLECRQAAGKEAVRAFCFRAHRGFDTVGIAQRRLAGGGLRKIECDPSRCPFFLQYRDGGQEAEISRLNDKYYTHADGYVFEHKGNYSQCKPSNYLLFNLYTPAGELAHPELHCSMLHTHSEVAHGRFQEILYAAAAKLNGRLRGLRFKLYYDPFASRHRRGKVTPAWNLEASDKSLRELIADMDARALPEKITEDTGTALVEATAQRDMELHQAEHGLTGDQLADALHADMASVHYIDPKSVKLVNHNPIVIALAERLGSSYVMMAHLPMRFGSDVTAAVRWYIQGADKAQVSVADILQGTPYESLLPSPMAVTPELLVEVEIPPAKEPECVEVEDVPPVEQVEQAVRGRRASHLDDGPPQRGLNLEVNRDSN